MSRSLPVWLLDSKQEITQSHQWPSFLQDLSEALHQQLRESNNGNLTTLTDAERALFIQNATQAIKKGQSYAALHKKISSTLDRQLNTEVQKQRLSEQLGSESRTDVVLNTAQDGIIALLSKWPNLRAKLYVCFNQALSEAMRPAVWRVCLQNTQAGKRFQRLVAEKPDAAHNKEIGDKCREIFKTESLLENLKTSKGALHAMTSVLSYYYNYEGQTEENLQTNYYRLIIPFILVNSASLPRKELATLDIMTHIMEEYLSFLNSLPKFILDPVQQRASEAFRIFASRVAQHLRQINLELSRAICSVFIKSQGSVTSTSGYDGQSDVSDKEILTKALIILCNNLIHNLFVGYGSSDTLLFVWDQYIIGLSSPGFCDEYLPAVTALFLHALHGDNIKNCNSLQQMEEQMKTEGLRVSVTQLQSEMRKHFYSELLERLKGNENIEQLPAKDNLGGYAWQGWFNTQVEPAAVDDRRGVKEEREAQRKRMMQAQLDKQRRLEEERQRVEEEERKRETARLRRQHQLATEKYRQETEQLKRRIRELVREKELAADQNRAVVGETVFEGNRTPGVLSRNSYGILPALSPADESAADEPLALSASSPAPDLPVEVQSRDAIKDFITRMAFSFNKIVNGEGVERDRLDRATLQSVEEHRRDTRDAAIQVFGRALQPGEFEGMSKEVQEEKSEEILRLVHERMKERYSRQLEA